MNENEEDWDEKNEIRWKKRKKKDRCSVKKKMLDTVMDFFASTTYHN